MSNEEGVRLSVALIGSTGRMGREVTKAIASHSRLKLGASIDREALASMNQSLELIKRCDIMIDFSTAAAQERVGRLISQLSEEEAIPLVTGVTGLSEAHQATLSAYAAIAPVFQASNFSLGVALLKRLALIAAEALGEEYDTEVYELHHRHKLDAPSGTAISLAEAVVEGKKLGGDQKASLSFSHTTPRDPSAVQVSAGRGGGVFGDHSLFFLGEHERIELSHSALNRSVFASGALRAALWCIGRAPGFYHMEDLWER